MSDSQESVEETNYPPVYTLDPGLGMISPICPGALIMVGLASGAGVAESVGLLSVVPD